MPLTEKQISDNIEIVLRSLEPWLRSLIDGLGSASVEQHRKSSARALAKIAKDLD